MSDDLPELLREVGRRLDEAQKIAIASHARPDGDAIGSLVALGDALTRAGKDVVMLNQDQTPERYRFLDGSGEIRQPDQLAEPLEVDAFVALDTADAKRIGDDVWKAVPTRRLTIVLDHHISNERYGDLNYVDAVSPATGQIVYELIRQQNWELSARARDNLWTAIVTDTGSFQYANTTSRTLEIAADLLREGADVAELSQRIYQNYPFRRLQLLGALIDSLERSPDGKIASWKLRRETMDSLGICSEDTEGLIDHLRAIDGVIVAAAFEEVGDGTVRVSARSKSDAADVSAVCQEFGGGGHKLAAGARIPGHIDRVARKFLQTARKQLES